MKKIIWLLIFEIILFSSVTLGVTPYPAGINPFGAEEYWSLDDVATSDIGKTDGTNVGCAYNTSTVMDSGKSLYCDGGASNVFKTNWKNLTRNENATFSLWLMTQKLDTGDLIFGAGVIAQRAYNFQYYDGTPNYESWFYIRDNLNKNDIVYITPASTHKIFNNSWTNIIITRTNTVAEGGKIAVYYNGSNKTAYHSTTDETVAEEQISSIFTYLNKTHGNIDDILIFKRNLSYGERHTIFAGNYSGLTSPLNVTITHPQNNHGFNSDNISANMYINITHNGTGGTANTTCNINNSNWNKDSNTSTEWIYRNNTPLIDGTYSINASCTNRTIGGYDTIYFTVDITDPVITPIAALSGNNTIVYNGTLSSQIQFTDNLEIYSINITLGNGTQMYYWSNIGLTAYEVNISYGVNSNKTESINARVCDAHTGDLIKEIERIDIGNNGLKYVIKDRPMLANDDYLYIYPKSFLDYTTPDGEFLKDRYTFTFNKRTSVGTETFVVEATEKIDIAKGENYDGHLIIKDLGKNGYWIDFENDEATKYEIKRINDYKVEITVYGLKSNAITFNSVGELNCIEATYWFNNLNPTKSYVTHTSIGTTNPFYLNVTTDSNIVTSISANLTYNNTIYSDTTENFSISIAAPSAVSGADDNISFNWSLTVNGLDYNLTGNIQNVSDFGIDNCSTYTTPILNISIRNVSTGVLIVADLEYIFTYTNSFVTKNYTNSLTTSSERFCISPSYSSITTDIQFDYTYQTDTYSQFYNDLALSNQSINKTLYASEGTSIVTFTVTDENDDEVEDVYIQVQEYDVGTGNYLTTEILKTNSDGVALGNLVLNTIWYRFILTYDGNIVLTTDNQKITEIRKEFRIILGTTPESIQMKVDLLDIVLTKSKSKKQFNLTWNNIARTATEIQLNITTGNQTSGIRSIYIGYSSVDDGTLGYQITEDTENATKSYVANVYVVSIDDGQRYFIDSESIEFVHAWAIFGDETLFMTFIMVGTMAFIGLFISVYASLILTTIALIGSVLLGFFQIITPALAALIVVIMILIIKIRRGGAI